MLNSYLLKAIDAYPYEVEETVENLNYALSYEANNAYALFLMGRIHAEHFCDYEKAKQYYAEALANKMDFVKVYRYYVLVLMWNEDYEEAQKLIDFAFTVKGLNKGVVHLLQGQLFEALQKFKKAIKAHNKAKLNGCNNDFVAFVDAEISRIKNKMKPNKEKSKNKKKKKKKK